MNFKIDKFGNELDQAKKLISDRKINLVDLSKITNIAYPTLRGYRFNPAKLDKASWRGINTLSNVYLQNLIKSNLDSDTMISYSKILQKKFKDWKMTAIENNQSVAPIEKIEDIILSNPLAILAIYQVDNLD